VPRARSIRGRGWPAEGSRRVYGRKVALTSPGRGRGGGARRRLDCGQRLQLSQQRRQLLLVRRGGLQFQNRLHGLVGGGVVLRVQGVAGQRPLKGRVLRAQRDRLLPQRDGLGEIAGGLLLEGLRLCLQGLLERGHKRRGKRADQLGGAGGKGAAGALVLRRQPLVVLGLAGELRRAALVQPRRQGDRVHVLGPQRQVLLVGAEGRVGLAVRLVGIAQLLPGGGVLGVLVHLVQQVADAAAGSAVVADQVAEADAADAGADAQEDEAEREHRAERDEHGLLGTSDLFEQHGLGFRARSSSRAPGARARYRQVGRPGCSVSGRPPS
jgi:hypothetical protein